MQSIIEKLLPKHILGYFSPKDGITMSEANHIANMTKEIAEVSSAKVQNIVSSRDEITIDTVRYTLKEFTKPEDKDFSLPGSLFGLSAWLRQAIKAKEEALNIISDANLNNFGNEQPKRSHTAPNKAEFNFPTVPMDIDIKFPFGTILSIPEYAEYLALEAKAAFLGKAIHQNAPVDRVRNEILNWQPISFMKFDGAERLVTRTKLFTEDEINTLYFKLQAEHREVEGKLNWYKAKIKNDAVILKSKATAEYTALYNEAQSKYSEAMRQYNDAEREFDKQFTLWSAEALQTRKEVQKLFSSYRIIIPQHFQEIYEYVLDIMKPKS